MKTKKRRRKRKRRRRKKREKSSFDIYRFSLWLVNLFARLTNQSINEQLIYLSSIRRKTSFARERKKCVCVSVKKSLFSFDLISSVESFNVKFSHVWVVSCSRNDDSPSLSSFIIIIIISSFLSLSSHCSKIHVHQITIVRCTRERWWWWWW